MSKQVKSDPESFRQLEELAKFYDAPGRTPSAALLLWFLTTVFRVDDIEAEDSVCDRKHDEGFDAVITNDIRQEIVVFQAKRKEKVSSTLGDTDLKQFVGSLKQLASESSVRKLISGTPNDELAKLLNDLDVPGKIKAGYRIRPIFVCNVAANSDAKRYIDIAKSEGREIDLWDLTRIDPVLQQLKRDWFVTEEIKLIIDKQEVFCIGDSKTSPSIAYAAIKATELVKLPGIEDCRLFAQNVRLGLGSTKVNDDILSSVNKKKEHKDFLLFHNGMTIVAKKLSVYGSKLTLNDYSVCNGCQSLLTFYNNRKRLTNDLKVLVRFVKVDDDRKMSEIIAYRTNNQNSISLRDLSSNDTTQIRIKDEFDALFGNALIYSTKRGDIAGLPQLQNEYAGRLLLALYTGEPWSAHQKYKVFGELESKIFSYYINSYHIRLSYLIAEEIKKNIDVLENKRMARYGLTLFVLLYMTGETLKRSSDGKRLLESPEHVLEIKDKKNPKQSKALSHIGGIIKWIMIDINYLINSKGGEVYDYKREFKSPKAIVAMKEELLRDYEKNKYMKRAVEFKMP